MNCPRCNSQVADGNSFCPSCGFNLNGQNNMNNNSNSNNPVYNNNVMNNQQMINPSQQMQQGNYNQVQQNMNQNKKRSKMVTCIIILDIIAVPLMILQLAGGDLKIDNVVIIAFANVFVFLNDAKSKKNNINK